MNSVAGLAASSLFGAISGYELLSNPHSPHKIALTLILLGVLFLFVHSLRLLIKPMTMLELTKNGLVFHCYSNMRLPQKLFIPYDRIVSLQMVKRKLLGQKHLTTLIQATLRTDQEWILPDLVRHQHRNLEDNTDIIYIDANPAVPRGGELLTQVQRLRHDALSR